MGEKRKRKKGAFLLGISFRDGCLYCLIQLNQTRNSREGLERLHEGKLVEVTGGNYLG